MESGQLVATLAPQEFAGSGDPLVKQYLEAFGAAPSACADRGIE